MPSVEGKFPTFHAFASASLNEIYGDKLNSAFHVVANHLESGVWMNRPGENGTPRFEWIPFPRIAQIAPTYGVVVQDFNGDQIPDIHLVQNFYSTQPETGLWRGGLSQLLMGKGDGAFAPVSPRESGIIIPDDGKSSALVDLDGDHQPELVATQNNGPTLKFRQQASPFKAISLKGATGNKHGIGAIISLDFSDRKSTVHELKAGSGYLGQSPAMIYTSGSDLKAVTVRWPDGHQASYPARFDSNLMTIKR